MGLRNVVHRRNHKERAQPAHRKKFGLLEKHKDYIQRARDHNVKKERIKKLAQKAALRNPDEFNFGMIRSSSKDPLKGGGLHVVRRRGGDSEPLDNDLVAILKSQDLSYVRNAIRSEEKKIKGIKESILPQLGFMTKEWIEAKDGRKEVLLSQELLSSSDADAYAEDQPLALAGKKTVWVESAKEAKTYKADRKKPVKKYSLNMSDDTEEEAQEQTQVANTKANQKRLGLLVSQLDARQQRLDTLNEARSKLEVVRALMTTKGTNARKVQAKSDTLKAAIVNGKVTSGGLQAEVPEEEEDEEDDEGAITKKKTTLWKWGRERKR